MLNRWIKYLLLGYLALAGCTATKTVAIDHPLVVIESMAKGNYIRHVQVDGSSAISEFYLVLYIGDKVDVAALQPTGEVLFAATYIDGHWLDSHGLSIAPWYANIIDAIVWAEVESDVVVKELTARGAEVTIADDQSLTIKFNNNSRSLTIIPKPTGYDLIVKSDDEVGIIHITNPEQRND